MPLLPARFATAAHERPPGLCFHTQPLLGSACKVSRLRPRYARAHQRMRSLGSRDTTRRALTFDDARSQQQGNDTPAAQRHTAAAQVKHREVRSFVSQNCWGVKSDSRIAQMLDTLGCRHTFAAFLQETWRMGDEEFEEDGYTFLGSAPASQGRRGSKGVAIILSRAATAAWRAAGAMVWRHGPRVIATRALVTDPRQRGKQLGLLMGSLYAPTSNASTTEWDDYYEAKAAALAHARSGSWR